MELLCPAGNLGALQCAIDEGADAVYIGLKNETNARHFAGLNFTSKQLRQGVDYVRRHKRKLHIAINTFAHPGKTRRWFDAVDEAAEMGADTLILADLAVLDYASQRYPDLDLHVSVQASSTNAATIAFFQQEFGVSRAVLPRVLSIHQVKQLARQTDIELEVFAFGSLCIMAEGRCYLSSYLTGESPNTMGACSPAKYVQYEEQQDRLNTRLNGVLIDSFSPDEQAGYPTLCKGRFEVDGQRFHVLEEPTSLNTMEMLPSLMKAGVAAVKIEGRQRSRVYVQQVTRAWRQAIDQCQANPQAYIPNAQACQSLSALSEGSQTTLGAYHRAWQ